MIHQNNLDVIYTGYTVFIVKKQKIYLTKNRLGLEIIDPDLAERLEDIAHEGL